MGRGGRFGFDGMFVKQCEHAALDPGEGADEFRGREVFRGDRQKGGVWEGEEFSDFLDSEGGL